jgi:hypothetical protein
LVERLEFYDCSSASSGSSHAIVADERRDKCGDPGLSELGIDRRRLGGVLRSAGIDELGLRDHGF